MFASQVARKAFLEDSRVDIAVQNSCDQSVISKLLLQKKILTFVFFGEEKWDVTHCSWDFGRQWNLVSPRNERFSMLHLNPRSIGMSHSFNSISCQPIAHLQSHNRGTSPIRVVLLSSLEVSPAIFVVLTQRHAATTTSMTVVSRI